MRWRQHKTAAMCLAKAFTSKVIILVVATIALLNCFVLYNSSLYSYGFMKLDNEEIIEATVRPRELKKCVSPTTQSTVTKKDSPASEKTTNIDNKSNTGDNKSYVLLINTLGRSGSSWVGELLSQQDGHFYIYEPDFYLAKYIKEEIDSSNGPQLIKDQFNCSFTEDFIAWARNKRTQSPQSVFRSKFTKSCWSNKNCLWPDKIKSDCESSTVRIIKMIRLRVSYVDTLLKDPELKSLKVIYLVRDPRASLISRTRLGWESNPEMKCKILEEDIDAYIDLHRRYPERTYLLRYEDLCINTKDEGTWLWNFLSHSKEPMPKMWSSYLRIHSRKGLKEMWRETAYAIDRDTKTEWTNWRNEVFNFTLFHSIERHCTSSIDRLCYTKFGSITRLKDLSVFGLRPVEECPEIFCSG